MDFLNWASNNEGEAFLLGVFIIVMTVLTANFILRVIRSITGKYPAPDTVVSCSHTFPCKCCREFDCQANCDCWADKQDADFIEDNA